MSDQQATEHELIQTWNRGISGLKLNCGCFILALCVGIADIAYLLHIDRAAMLQTLLRQGLSLKEAFLFVCAIAAIPVIALLLLAIPLGCARAARHLREAGFIGTTYAVGLGKHSVKLSTTWGQVEANSNQIVPATGQFYFPHTEVPASFPRTFEVRIKERDVNPGAERYTIVFTIEVVSCAELELCRKFPHGPAEFEKKIVAFFRHRGAPDSHSGNYPSNLLNSGIFVENQRLFRVTGIARDHEPN